MTYDPDNLSALAYANGFTVWHYKTRDSRAEVDAPGYFSRAWHLVRTRDRIHVDCADASADCIFFTHTEEGDVRIVPMTVWVEVPAVRRAA